MIQSALFLQVEKTRPREQGFAKSGYDLVSAFPMLGWVCGKPSTKSLWGLYGAYFTDEGTESGTMGTTLG